MTNRTPSPTRNLSRRAVLRGASATAAVLAAARASFPAGVFAQGGTTITSLSPTSATSRSPTPRR